MEESVERPALYYPYIHIRSEHWLKATLLCVPSVKRIVPESYTPEDTPQIAKYVNIEGPNGKLLQGVPAFSLGANAAQQRLLEELRAKEGLIRGKFTRGQTSMPDSYWIHDEKFNHELLDYLSERDLAWHSHPNNAYGHRTWYALHPTLGSAIMTTIGLSIAREQKYDIVTPSAKFHETLLTTKESSVFDALLTSKDAASNPTTAQTRNEMGQLVVTLTGVNFQALNPEDIPELQASRHFGEFQRLIRNRAPSVGPDVDYDEYHKSLLSQATEIINTWHETRREVSSEIRQALFEQTLLLSAEAIKHLLAHTETIELVAAGGVAVGLLAQKGLSIIRKRRAGSPYQYLTQIINAQSELLRATFPLGLEQ